MPTYQYECTSCDHQFELVQSFTDAPASECPDCGKPVRKVFSNIGVVFKGSGFYKTDSRSSSDSSTAKSSTPTKTEPSKSEASKPAASTDTTPK
ncbi:MAG: FmdB family transcriptional regulator [Actinobacteria bacterium]|nr:FmdB family transcriptional regulator [Actinomycetota bacterium]